jgi:hypothetical protein
MEFSLLALEAASATEPPVDELAVLRPNRLDRGCGRRVRPAFEQISRLALPIDHGTLLPSHRSCAMSSITLDLPDELAERVRLLADRLPRILDLGMRALSAESPAEYAGAAEVLELLARLPSPEEVLALRASDALAERAQSLLEKNRAGGLSADEELEWQRIEYLEHLVRVAKAKAALKLKAA